jgi:hypothetical protein
MDGCKSEDTLIAGRNPDGGPGHQQHANRTARALVGQRRSRVWQLLPCVALALALATSATQSSAVILMVVLDRLELFEIEGLTFVTYGTSEGTRLQIEDTDTSHAGLVDLRGQTEARRDLTLSALSRERPGEKVLIAVDVAPLRGRAGAEHIELDARGTAGTITDPALAELIGPLSLGLRVVSEIVHPRTGIRRTTYRLESVAQDPPGPGAAVSALGEWTGFAESLVNPDSALSEVRLEITAQPRRRYSGELEIAPPGLGFPIEGLLLSCSDGVSGLGEVAGCSNNLFQGATRAGVVVGHTRLFDFGAGAAVIDGRLRQHLRDRTREVGSLLALRQFAGNTDTAPPDVTGSYRGTYRSETGFGNDVMVITLHAALDEGGAPTQRLEGSGFINEPRTGVERVFETLGTTDVDGQIVAINQGDAGRLILNANFVAPLDPDTAARIAGRYRLVFDDCCRDEGSFLVELQAPANAD